MSKHDTLIETPLVAILLAHHACTNTDGLPRTRGRVLDAVVDGFVRRWERRRDLVLGSLSGSDAAYALIDVFVTIGRVMLTTAGVSTAVLERAVAEMLREDWCLGPSAARATAESLCNAWDQAGLFPVVGSPRTTIPRLRPFLDLAQAKAAVAGSLPDRNALFNNQRLDVLELAASLDREVANSTANRALAGGDACLINVAVDAQLHWGDTDQLNSLAHTLLSKPWNEPAPAGLIGIRADFPAWLALRKILANPVASAIEPDLRVLLGSLPQPAQAVGAALLAESTGSPDLRSALATVAALDESTFARHGIWQEGLALVSRHLLPEQPSLAPLLARHPTASIEADLREHGHGGAFEQLHARFESSLPRTDGFAGLFELLCRMEPPCEASWRERRQLADLAIFFELLVPGHAVGINADQPAVLERDDAREIIQVLRSLVPSRQGVIAAQARLVHCLDGERFRHVLRSLWDFGIAKAPAEWPVDSPADDLAATLLAWLGQGRWRRTIANRALEHAPNSETVVAGLSNALHGLPARARVDATLLLLEHVDDHLDAALTLSRDPDPIIRGEAAAVLAYAYNDGAEGLGEALRAILLDQDLAVRSRAALNLGVRYWSTEFTSVRDRASAQPLPGWVCRHCGVLQEPTDQQGNGTLSCRACHVIGISWPSPTDSDDDI